MQFLCVQFTEFNSILIAKQHLGFEDMTTFFKLILITNLIALLLILKLRILKNKRRYF